MRMSTESEVHATILRFIAQMFRLNDPQHAADKLEKMADLLERIGKP